MQALRLVGLEKTATPIPVPAAETLVSRALAAAKKLVPETNIGRGAAAGGLIGTGVGAHALATGRRPEPPMERPYIHRGSALTYPQ